ncbi:protein of unknown function [Candidatus Methylomirabilis oxygeniifera]|uniref:Uncharacterized protein n=1 Tax=Methylomirabilis oxygeniifera TaxID=671143 RepID=D5MMA4_METO1|nr:protein of unknown function [Candidatus Methylomirabilis oxyfera]
MTGSPVISTHNVVRERMDTFIVVCDRDIKLLRHFFLSYELFFRSPGRIYLFISRKDKPLLDLVRKPKNLVVLYKDDVPDLGEDDFRNQMYLKMIADRYVETDWFWVPDADYLICSPIQASDFMRSKVHGPLWFYRNWDGGPPEQSWRQGSERFLRETIPFLFMDAAEYIMNKNILVNFRELHDLDDLLVPSLKTSEFIVYGAFAHRLYHDYYKWIDLDSDSQTSLAYKVNQRPPTYCELDEDVNLSSMGSAKYAVFWSHWDKSEQKMVEFLIDAQIREFGEVRVEPDTQPLYLALKTGSLSRDDFIAIGGAYSDGWVKTESAFHLTVPMPCELVLKLEVPLCLAHNTTRLSLQADDTVRNFTFTKRHHMLRIPLKSDIDNIVRLNFFGGIAEPNGGRRLYAQLTQMFVQPYGWNPLRRT